MTPPVAYPPEPELTRPEARLSVLVNEGIKRKGISLQKLSEVSGIAMKYIGSLSGGNVEKFPPAPYLRSYLLILGRILDFDGEAVWESIRVDELSTAGRNDRLPHRRLTIPSKTKLWWIGGIGLVLTTYLFFRLPEIIGQPNLAIGFPTDDVTTVSLSPVTIIGTVKNGDELYINGERIPISADGLWQKSVELQEGMNTIELKAKKFLGQEIRLLRQVIYVPNDALQPANTSSTTTTSSTTRRNTTSTEE